MRSPSCDPGQVHPRIRHFCEHAAEYHLEVWSEVYLAGRFFLWLLVEFISRRMYQLNSPISSLKVTKGMTSEIVQLREPASGRLVYTGCCADSSPTEGYLRRDLFGGQASWGDHSLPEGHISLSGSANVYLRPCSYPDGSFGLVSTGGGFGCAGFYRIGEAGKDAWRVRNFITLHEIFYVYLDQQDVMRTDHTISFQGLTILRLHYKMRLARGSMKGGSAGSEVRCNPNDFPTRVLNEKL